MIVIVDPAMGTPDVMLTEVVVAIELPMPRNTVPPFKVAVQICAVGVAGQVSETIVPLAAVPPTTI